MALVILYKFVSDIQKLAKSWVNKRIIQCKSQMKRLRNKVDSVSVAGYENAKKGLAEVLHIRRKFIGDKDRSNCLVEDDVLDCIPYSVTTEQNMNLLRPVEGQEVKEALFQMHPDKSLGLDGMTPTFYKKCWNIVGYYVVKTVPEFFAQRVLPNNLNDMNLFFIPKKKNLVAMGDLQPIALCNVLYKVISKVLANRMKGLLSSVVSDYQSAFIQGRLIIDNVMISSEVLHHLKQMQ
ncbi:uncharacterized protein LOC133795050 [Humulus lupulus]|uniref:uncharacterized protein LOC133795050 n=1 Tax=Humulus lupulus TaxID=3486 RepID=UPI002B403AAD|nr:uncharacterized protein LOC133795050 [Humulus lupulus]